MIHQPSITLHSSSPNQFVPNVSRLPCSSGLVRHTLLFVHFFKELVSFIASLDKCHTSVFNALIEKGKPRYISEIISKSESISEDMICKDVFKIPFGCYCNYCF